ncbi:MAG TPA: DUF2339 domain-containing protein, partial [Thermoanaerobaculia bacterium]|nr:DUF2339 domain-containing protein [Thermoanaerobaculia bacterium]
FNWYLYTYLISAAAFFAGARLLEDARGFWDAFVTPFRNALLVGATVLLFVLLNVEIADVFSTGSTVSFHFFDATLAQDLNYTIWWALFATAMLVVGIVKKNRPARISALVLLVVTILKCFVHDLGRLGGLYRVGSIVGLGICLVAVALLLQRFVLKREEEPVP